VTPQGNRTGATTREILDAIRALRGARTSTAVALVLLTVGIGAGTAVLVHMIRQSLSVILIGW